ncbi:MAG TPA: hypothetical protein VFG54_22140, partial [Prolixibacteraceae bacterium]|nr:hypothetical protein [Prolixibacteraceae bacterium]
YELNSNFNPTGRTFHTTTDAKGHFELKGVELVSPYVEMVADGFYFNEVSGSLSGERMILKAIIDLTNQGNININVLTNLEFERVKYLIASKGKTIAEAKQQAQQELLKVFSMDTIQIGQAECLDIVNPGEADAVLLAVSSILQANRTTAELSKLQADIILDMKEDGTLGDTIIQSDLINHSMALKLDKIRENLLARYKELGVEMSTTNNFDKYVTYFNRHTSFHYNSPYVYPVSTANGKNILFSDNTHFESMALNSLAVKMPTTGTLKVIVKLTDGIGPWFRTVANHGWQIGEYDWKKNQQVFTSTLNNEIIDMQIGFDTYGAALVEYYYDDSTVPSLTKNITWGSFNGSRFNFGDSLGGLNLLALTDGSEIKNTADYVIGVYDNAYYKLNFTILYPASLTVEVKGGWGNYTPKIVAGGMELILESKEFPELGIIGGVSEMILKFNGTGQITIESDLRFPDGHLLKKTLQVIN